MKKIFFFQIYLFISLSIYSQQSDITVSGEFVNTPFVNFIKEIEKTTDIKFYYNEKWVEDVNVTFSGINLKLDSVLNNLFLN